MNIQKLSTFSNDLLYTKLPHAERKESRFLFDTRLRLLSRWDSTDTEDGMTLSVVKAAGIFRQGNGVPNLNRLMTICHRSSHLADGNRSSGRALTYKLPINLSQADSRPGT